MIFNCKITKIEASDSHVFKVFIKPDQCFQFKAGQYAIIYLNNKQLPFSIANSPNCNELIELHVGGSVKETAIEAISYFNDAFIHQTEFKIDSPHGDAWLRDESESPLLLIAGGTGLSYINSILHHCIDKQLSQPIYLYWGVNNRQLLYADQKLKSLEAQLPNVKYVPVVEHVHTEWDGKIGNVIDAVMDDFADLSEFDIYVCGPFGMSRNAKDIFTTQKKANVGKMYSDAFSYM
ncbi:MULTISPECIES: NAD(P)H-flavin reductase [unclassified Photobacterium]|nr:MULTISPECIES: NAD(P)H-flavin reductase [unclassified Photobacterium]PSV26351.1 NAD(P)H-flavin reductase [Photobacterium sp. GB-56]PSV31534.1 NAD(P)H-flavin reductase [Photobacterium sp. GB-72]PSV33798.1 NAD(P)H-flavin reductase [Photobacterium sp. GB-27]PSV36821.1 NAD(P)H-flavin reductase [Photobacterium sp. GB-210]PSV46072.1 NAD(P)H-flavin reductase [Photobacterium sp. GB-36]PSW74255.1 NAD(P)H-flavin reductase [Photobacterium sp. GB-50]